MTRTSRAFGRSLLAASALLALGSAGPALAAPGKDGHGRHMGAQMCGHGGMGAVRRLAVTGQGEARIAPDMAMVQAGVTAQADTAAEAMRQTSAQQATVIVALKAAGVAETGIQTSGLNLNPVMDYGDGRAPRVTGYQASNIVGVRVTEIGNLGTVLDAIVGAGANEIHGISFGREDGADAEDEARREAVADAQHKAEVLAEAAGLELGPVLMLRDSEMHEAPRPMMRMAAEAAGAADSVPVQAGELSMSATVQIEYALIGGMPGCGVPGTPAPTGDGAEPAPEAPATDGASEPVDEAPETGDMPADGAAEEAN